MIPLIRICFGLAICYFVYFETGPATTIFAVLVLFGMELISALSKANAKILQGIIYELNKLTEALIESEKRKKGRKKNEQM